MWAARWSAARARVEAKIPRNINVVGRDPHCHPAVSAISIIFVTVRQLRAVAVTPSSRSALAASFDRPKPSGAWK